MQRRSDQAPHAQESVHVRSWVPVPHVPQDTGAEDSVSPGVQTPWFEQTSDFQGPQVQVSRQSRNCWDSPQSPQAVVGPKSLAPGVHSPASLHPVTAHSPHSQFAEHTRSVV